MSGSVDEEVRPAGSSEAFCPWTTFGSSSCRLSSIGPSTPSNWNWSLPDLSALEILPHTSLLGPGASTSVKLVEVQLPRTEFQETIESNRPDEPRSRVPIKGALTRDVEELRDQDPPSLCLMRKSLEAFRFGGDDPIRPGSCPIAKGSNH